MLYPGHTKYNEGPLQACDHYHRYREDVMIKRCDKILEEYEDKLQLVDKFMKARKQVEKMKDCISELMEENQDDRLNLKIEAIDRLSDRILDEF